MPYPRPYPRNDGGPAFPETAYYDEKPIGSDGGMSLRDWFAGQAMAGALAHGNPDCLPILTMACESYKTADALLKARDLVKPKGE